MLASLGLFLHELIRPGATGPRGGYWFWSGIGSDIGELTIVAAAVVFYRRHECHIQGCWRPAWHPHPEHGHPVCKRHHPDRIRLAAPGE